MSDSTSPSDHWCPVHGLHAAWWECPLDGWMCEADNGQCMEPPIAPEVVQAIEAAAIARERIAVVELLRSLAQQEDTE